MFSRLFRLGHSGALALFFLMISTTLLQAQNSKINDPQLLIFSGSDWCIPCIKFERTVRQDPTFVAFSEKNLEVIIADFPQHKKLDKETEKRNEALAEKYNPNGIFPMVLLNDNNGQVLSQIKTHKVTAQDVIDQIKSNLPKESIVERSRDVILMGSSFQITLVADEVRIDNLLDDAIAEIKVIESWLSSWEEGSITTKLNETAGERPVEVTEDYYELLQRCIQISQLTQGAFDITFTGLGDLYRFDGQENELPSQDLLVSGLMHIGYDKIELLEGNEISFGEPGIRIGFGAIGKGFAAEQVKKLMINKGVEGGVINASGDLCSWGIRADGSDWKVGIPDPQNKSTILLWLPLTGRAMATSGDYEKYFINNGIRYSHIINPKTGLPVIGSRSVSVMSSSAELSDALATAVSVMGYEIGLDLIDQLEGVECIFIDDNRKLHFSNGLKTYEN